MKNTAILLSSVLCVTLSGCTTSYSRVQEAVSAAPDWYESRREEIRGEGYPDLTSVPVIEAGAEPGRTLPLSIEMVDKLIDDFAANPRSEPPSMTPAEIEAFAASTRAEFEGAIPPSTHLTETQIAEIRESFNVPRVTQGLRVTN